MKQTGLFFDLLIYSSRVYINDWCIFRVLSEAQNYKQRIDLSLTFDS